METPKQSALKLVQRVILEILGVETKNYKPTDSFEKIGADSLDLTELAAAFELAFNIEFTAEDYKTVKSPNDVVDFFVDQKGWKPE